MRGTSQASASTSSTCCDNTAPPHDTNHWLTPLVYHRKQHHCHRPLNALVHKIGGVQSLFLVIVVVKPFATNFHSPSIASFVHKGSPEDPLSFDKSFPTALGSSIGYISKLRSPRLGRFHPACSPRFSPFALQLWQQRKVPDSRSHIARRRTQDQAMLVSGHAVLHVVLLINNALDFWTYQTNGKCTDHCKALGTWAFAVIQFNDCWCSNYIPSTTTDITDCQKDCPGYPTEKCGDVDAGLYIYIKMDGQPSGTVGGSQPSSTSVSSATPVPSTDTPSTSDAASVSTSMFHCIASLVLFALSLTLSFCQCSNIIHE